MTAGNNILLINRDEQYCQEAVRELQASDYTVHTATEMRSALSILAAHNVGLIICDTDLDDISGNDFLSFIKRDPLRENIPLMFLVPLANQGRPFKAFELGAVDYLVYPVPPEVLNARVEEYFLPEARKAPEETPEEIDPADTAAPAPPTVPKGPMPPVEVEVSRDGVIWMPSKITRFSAKNVFMQTSLFGKKGVSLILRFKRPEGAFVVYGRINEISFNDFQSPADIDAAVEESEAWQHILEWLTDLREHGGQAPSEAPTAEEENECDATVAMTSCGEDSSISAEELFEKADRNKNDYDIRFYNSIIGKQLDNYRVIALIAAGSMGGVLQGWDVALEREVALKIISFELSSKDQFRDMFVKEARVVSKLNHINIAQIYNIGLSNDILYYAMEFINGQTLKDLLSQQGKLSLLKGMSILSTVCKGLETVYQHGIVHRDIKPANIMINQAGDVKIVDFGVAHNKESKVSGKNKLMGTPLYMSPEQIVGLTLDHRSDMYSLGATFYHAFGGTPPFVGKSVSDILDHHLNTELTPLLEKNEKLPEGLNKIIEKMMAKDPNHRYQSFKQITDELHILRNHLISVDRSRSKR